MITSKTNRSSDTENNDRTITEDYDISYRVQQGNRITNAQASNCCNGTRLAHDQTGTSRVLTLGRVDQRQPIAFATNRGIFLTKAGVNPSELTQSQSQSQSQSHSFHSKRQTTEPQQPDKRKSPSTAKSAGVVVDPFQHNLQVLPTGHNSVGQDLDRDPGRPRGKQEQDSIVHSSSDLGPVAFMFDTGPVRTLPSTVVGNIRDNPSHAVHKRRHVWS